jgi:dihydroflavonol-4-reductase
VPQRQAGSAACAGYATAALRPRESIPRSLWPSERARPCASVPNRCYKLPENFYEPDFYEPDFYETAKLDTSLMSFDFSSELPRALSGANVLLTGATGFTGSVLLRKLVEAGANVRAIARSRSSIDRYSALPVKWFIGNVYDADTVRAAASEVDYIFHLAAAYRQAKITDEEYRLVHVDSTKLLVSAALKRRGFKRFIHVSTIGVHGHIDNPPADENTRFSPGDQYQCTKAEAELWVHDFARENKLPYTVIRPAGIYGPGDRRLFKVFKMASWPLFPILGHGRCLYHLIHVEDLTDAILLAAVHPQALSEAFIVGADEPIELERFAATVAKTLGRKLRVKRVPAGPFFVAAAACEAICKPLGIEPPLYRRRVAFYTKDRSFRTDKIRDTLGFRPQYSNERGIAQTTEWYVENGWLKSDRPSSAMRANVAA